MSMISRRRQGTRQALITILFITVTFMGLSTQPSRAQAGEILDQANEVGTFGGYIDSAAEGQTFTASVSGQLTRVEIQVAVSYSSYAIAIQGVNAQGTPTDEVLATGTLAANQTGWVSIALTPQPFITAGTQYAIILRGTPFDGGLYFPATNSSSYPQGTYITTYPGVWVAAEDMDINFRTYVIPQAPTATPTYTPTATPTSTPTATATNTFTPVPPTATATATSTFTPVPPTATATNTFTPVPPTATATATNTFTPVPPTATATNTPVPPTATATNTPVPPTATPTVPTSLYTTVQQVRTALTTLLPSGDNKTNQALQAAIAKLDQGHAPDFWQLPDGNHLSSQGDKAFHRLHDALKELRKLKTPAAVVSTAIDALTNIGRTLAEQAITAATTAGGNAKRLAEAAKEMTKAQQDLAKQRPDLAFAHYEEAWEAAQRAMGVVLAAADPDESPVLEDPADAADSHAEDGEAVLIDDSTMTERLFLPLVVR